MSTSAKVILQTKTWVERLVIAYSLCPFAKKPFQQNTIRYVVSEASDAESLTHDLIRELQLMQAKPAAEIETTLLIHPNILHDFEDYLDYLAFADLLLQDLSLEGVIQLASFHPQYQFAGTKAEDAENFTNRSPFPMLHLLREDSMSEALKHYPQPEVIPERNIETMKQLGAAFLTKLHHEIIGKN